MCMYPRRKEGAIVRKALLVLVVACITLALAAPAALAGEPYRFHVRGVDRFTQDPVTLPAGLACPFILQIESEGQITYWMFPDGHEATSKNFTRTLTNLETGASIDHLSAYHATIYHRDDGTTLETDHGSFIVVFFPGDHGPNGVVGPSGETYFMTGTAKTIYGVDGAITSFSLDGQSSDVCQLLSS
jgi:hypothetical protein